MSMDEDKAEAIHAMTGIDPENGGPHGGGEKRQTQEAKPTPTAQTFAEKVDRRTPAAPVQVTPAPAAKGADRAPTPRGFSPGSRAVGAPVVSNDSERDASTRDRSAGGSEAKGRRTIAELRGEARAGWQATQSAAASRAEARAAGAVMGRPSRAFGKGRG